MARLAVLMPNYNNAPFLNEAIDSILNQTYSDFDFIIVDDKSTDNGVEIIQDYNDDRIKLILKETNSGIVDTMNLGLDSVNSEYVIRMDGDDISTPDRFEKLVQFMDDHPEVDICSSYLETFGASNNKVTPPEDHNSLKAGLVFSSKIPHAPSIFRSKIFKELGFRYREDNMYMEDYDLFFRLKDKVQFRTLPHIFYKYRILDHNSTVSNMDTFEKRYNQFHRQVVAELGVEVSHEHLDLHYRIAKIAELKYKCSDYRRYVRLLRKKNSELQIYPIKEFNELLAERFESLYYRAADEGFWKGLGWLLCSKPSLSKLKYLLRAGAAK